MNKTPILRMLNLQLALGLLLVSSLACTHENPLSLELEGNIAMIRLPGGGEGLSGQCLPLEEVQMRPNGVLDLMVTTRYDFFPRVENRLPGSAAVSGIGPENLRSEAQTITIEGAEMTLQLDTTTEGPLKIGVLPWRTTWYSPFILQLEPGEKLGSKFTLIPSDVGKALKDQFNKFPGKRTARQVAIVEIKLIGRMADGSTLISNTIKYPVDICWGCLVSLPVSIGAIGIDPELQYQVCSQKQTPQTFTPPCMPGNDEYVPCGFYCFMCDQDNSCDDTVCPGA
ncbi:MAG: hypothetical protein KC502_00535 [Myxococcales bacterium]|nr:hypothetical protein [Myxococcales bacterium]